MKHKRLTDQQVMRRLWWYRTILWMMAFPTSALLIAACSEAQLFLPHLFVLDMLVIAFLLYQTMHYEDVYYRRYKKSQAQEAKNV